MIPLKTELGNLALMLEATVYLQKVVVSGCCWKKFDLSIYLSNGKFLQDKSIRLIPEKIEVGYFSKKLIFFARPITCVLYLGSKCYQRRRYMDRFIPTRKFTYILGRSSRLSYSSLGHSHLRTFPTIKMQFSPQLVLTESSDR